MLMFLQVSVCPQGEVYTPRQTHPPRQTRPPGRHPAPEMATAAEGKHRTGMDSCFVDLCHDLNIYNPSEVVYFFA